MKRMLFVLIALLLAVPASAQYTYTTIDYPGARIVRLVGFNDHFEAVGHYQMPGAVRHAMRIVNGEPVPIVDPDGLLQTYASAADQINNRGDITGWYQIGSARHGFVWSNGKLTTVDYPGAGWTMVCGITDTGIVFGYFYDAAGLAHGFTLEDGAFTQIDYPGARDTVPYYINARGDMVGNWDTTAGVVGRGFLRTKQGEWYGFDAPGAKANATIAIGINDHQQILGALIDATGYHGFVVDARDIIAGADPAAFTVFELPTRSACPETANNSGAFVGYYNDSTGVHGFIGAPVRGDLK